jgi:hypothetical protein
VVSFRPPIGKSDEPWPTPNPTASIIDELDFGQDRKGCEYRQAAPPDVKSLN